MVMLCGGVRTADGGGHSHQFGVMVPAHDRVRQPQEESQEAQLSFVVLFLENSTDCVKKL